MSKIVVLGGGSSLANAFLPLVERKSFEIVLCDQNASNCDAELPFEQVDLNHSSSITRCVQKLRIRRNSHVVLVTMAGQFGSPTTLENRSLSRFHESVQVNALGVMQFALEFLKRALSLQCSVRIVAVTSTAGSVGSSDLGYGVAKAALGGFVVSIAKEFAARNVTAFEVSPGVFDSPMSMNVSPERQTRAVQHTFVKRKGSAQEIARVVYFAALEAPNFMTGEVLRVNGGQYR